MANESEKIIDAFIAPAQEVNKELAPQETPKQPKSDEQTVAITASKADDTTETAIQKAARKGNKSAKKVADKAETPEEKAAREEQERVEAEAEAERERAEANKTALQQALDTPGGIARRTSNWIASAPTPGGIGVLVLALLFFLWAIVPVNAAGDTRLKLLWYTLIGRTQFTESTQVAGGSADFDNGTDNTATTGSGNGTGPVANGNVASGPDIIILSPFEV
jgi:hypothetical protein